MRKKILISAYAVSPYRGSEYGAAWNTINYLAKKHDVWVLYGMSDDHMGDTQTLRKYMAETPVPNVTFVEVGASRLANTINLLNKAGAGWFFYFAYYLWQKAALRTARALSANIDFDVVHQLGPIGYREPGFLWQLKKPMVWGPIGGMMKIDDRLIKDMPLRSRLQFKAKNLINYFQLNYSTRIKDAFKRADVLIAATTTGQRTIKEKFGRESYHWAEPWLIKEPELDATKFRKLDSQVKLVWAGTHNERKNMKLCLQALAGVNYKNWVLNVLGTGPLTASLKQMAADLGISDKIKWHGMIDRKEAVQIMAGSHLHIVTSIAEDNPNVVFEALSNAVPTLTINHFGMADLVTENSGYKVNNGAYQDVLAGFVLVLNSILENPVQLIEKAEATLHCAAVHNWQKRLARLDGFYEEAINVYHARANKGQLVAV
ncbi:glycosyltransferase [Mucilaginibacter pallidiroseus]|uniref:Glycosyltransferase n=1 Tax=Mucilaginibacter pallidiroseus TaxID=2599295 RepID=A0A563U0Q3_9SPHI|nr:glycosyltransferase [Mucilaginibacter pallidiroseus]TWR25208.1 glycosyltransferase [Mucilaginibacter pallidiroseus]